MPNDDNKQLTAIPFATDAITFTHTTPDSFIYFYGSEAAQYTTFGKPASEINSLINQLFNELKERYGQSNPYVQMLKQTKQKINVKMSSYQAESLYNDSEKITSRVKYFGHIPAIMSAFKGVSKYERSGNVLNTHDVTQYISVVPNSLKQIQEVLVKQDMMEIIANLRKSFVESRNQNVPGSESFVQLNNILRKLDDDIIEKNRISLPKYECFDLYSTFQKKLFDLVASLPLEGMYNFSTFRSHLFTILKDSTDNQVSDPVKAIQTISSGFYQALKDFYANECGITDVGDEDEVEFTQEVDYIVQKTLPIIQYLNSARNPFARNGLFGKVISTEFSNAALEDFKRHEKNVSYTSCLSEYTDLNKIPVQTSLNYSFDDDQVNILLFGNEALGEILEKQTNQSFFSSLASGISNLLVSGSTEGNNMASSSSQNIRHETLALPQHEVHGLLEYTSTSHSHNSPK